MFFCFCFFFFYIDLPETQAARPRGTAAQGALEAPPPSQQQSRELLIVVTSPSSLMEPASIWLSFDW